MLQCWHPCDNTRDLDTCTRGTCHTGQWPHVSDTGNMTCPWQISILPRNKLWTELLWIFVCENEIDDKLWRAAIYLTDWLTQVGQLTTRLQPLCVNLRFFRGLTPSFIRWITKPFVSIFTQIILCNCESDFRTEAIQSVNLNVGDIISFLSICGSNFRIITKTPKNQSFNLTTNFTTFFTYIFVIIQITRFSSSVFWQVKNSFGSIFTNFCMGDLIRR